MGTVTLKKNGHTLLCEEGKMNRFIKEGWELEKKNSEIPDPVHDDQQKLKFEGMNKEALLEHAKTLNISLNRKSTREEIIRTILEEEERLKDVL